MITEKLLEECLQEIKECFEFDEILSKCLDADVMTPSCIDSLISVLAAIFEDKDKWIEYFVYELWFGEMYEPNKVLTESGEEIRLANVHDLYELLISNLEGREFIGG